VQQQRGGCTNISEAVLGKNRKDAARIDGKDGYNLDMAHKGAEYMISNSDILFYTSVSTSNFVVTCHAINLELQCHRDIWTILCL